MAEETRSLTQQLSDKSGKGGGGHHGEFHVLSKCDAGIFYLNASTGHMAGSTCVPLSVPMSPFRQRRGWKRGSQGKDAETDRGSSISSGRQWYCADSMPRCEQGNEFADFVEGKLVASWVENKRGGSEELRNVDHESEDKRAPSAQLHVRLRPWRRWQSPRVFFCFAWGRAERPSQQDQPRTPGRFRGSGSPYSSSFASARGIVKVCEPSSGARQRQCGADPTSSQIGS